MNTYSFSNFYTHGVRGQKVMEVSEYLRSVNNTSVKGDSSLKRVVKNLRNKVSYLNKKYPTTAKLEVVLSPPSDLMFGVLRIKRENARYATLSLIVNKRRIFRKEVSHEHL